MPLGSLRDLVIYPMDAEQHRSSGRSDEDVLEVLKLDQSKEKEFVEAFMRAVLASEKSVMRIQRNLEF